MVIVDFIICCLTSHFLTNKICASCTNVTLQVERYVLLVVPAALGRLLHREQVLDGFTTKENMPVWFRQKHVVRIPSQVGNDGCVSEELFNERLIGKGDLSLVQLVSLCGEGVGSKKR